MANFLHDKFIWPQIEHLHWKFSKEKMNIVKAVIIMFARHALMLNLANAFIILYRSVA